MVRRRSLLPIAICGAALLLAPAGAQAAPNLEGFALTFPKAAALCVKADKGKLGKQLKPSKGKVRVACTTLKQSYSDALTALTATTSPLRVQMKGIVAEQRAACQLARRNRDHVGCRKAALDAKAKLSSIRTQIAAAQKTAQAAYEQARKTFWASIKKLRGGASVKPDAPAGQPEVTDVPPDTALDSTP
jgi:hypothetical protein